MMGQDIVGISAKKEKEGKGERSARCRDLEEHTRPPSILLSIPFSSPSLLAASHSLQIRMQFRRLWVPDVDFLAHVFATFDDFQEGDDRSPLIVRQVEGGCIGDPAMNPSTTGVDPEKVNESELVCGFVNKKRKKKENKNKKKEEVM